MKTIASRGAGRVLLSLILACSAAARAAVPGGVSVPIIPPPGANVIGGGTCAVTTVPPAGIATQTFVASAANKIVANVNTQIAGMSRVMDADLQQVITAVGQSSDALYERLEKLQLTSLTTAQMMENNMNFQSEVAFPAAACGSMSQATAAQIGAETGRDLKAKLSQDFQKYRYTFNTAESRRRELDELDVSEITAGSIFPADNTIDPQQLDTTHGLLKLVVNPEPPVNLPAGTEDTAQGRAYENTRKVMNAKQLPSEAALEAVMVRKMPSISGQEEAVRAMWAYMGGNGQPPGLTKDGLISPDALLYLQVATRAENPNWINGLNERNEIGLQREQVLIDAVRMQLEYRSYELLQHMTVLLAQMNGQQVQQMYGDPLNERRQQIIRNTGDVRP